MATASAGRADKGSSRGSRAFRAPLQHDRLAVGGQGRGEKKPKARQPSSCAQTQGATMSDPEIEELRDKVHCAVVLERTPPPWTLDRKESTKLSLKYRRGKGEILIVSHGGRGWWDPTSDTKGDAFSLVQRLEPGINFGHVRKRLREFAGLSPRFPIAERAGRRKASDRPVAERWADRKAMWPDSPTWRYLARKGSASKRVLEMQRCRQHPSAYEFCARASVHRALEGFQTIDLPFGLAVAPTFGQRVPDRVNILPQRSNEALHRVEAGSMGLFEPRVEFHVAFASK